jgi:centromeric protein E
VFQAAEIENLKQDKVRLIEQKDGLEVHSQKLAEEAAYAKELASAAAVELKALAEEVTKLSYQNVKLTSDLQAAQDSTFGRTVNSLKYGQTDQSQDLYPAGRRGIVSADIRRDLIASHEREAALETILLEKEQKEAEVQKELKKQNKERQILKMSLQTCGFLLQN